MESTMSKTVLITDCSSGFGEEAAHLFIRSRPAGDVRD